MLVVWRLLLVPVSVARPEVCSEAGLVACTALLTRALDKHDLGFVRTEAGLDGLCGDLLRGIACVRSFVANCSSAETRASFQLTASGALRTSSQLCTPRSDLRKDFLSHSSCFREIALSERACAGDYHSIMSAVAGANSSSASSLAALCCGYARFVSCSLRHVAVVPVCGAGAMQFIQRYLHTNIGRPLLDHCSLPHRCSGAAWAGTAWWLVMLSSLSSVTSTLLR